MNVTRLADRLDESRRRRFVGRGAELALFQSAFSASELPFNLLWLHGPGGVGKSTLLAEFARLARQTNAHVVSLDARYVDPSPDGFVTALNRSSGQPAEAPPEQSMGDSTRRGVLLVDTYELLTPLDNWLRESLLPRLPAQTLVVLAGRNPPTTAWSADPGWQNFIRAWPLRNLTPDEGRDYLTRREVPRDQHQAVLDFTRSHPLALALVADSYVQRGAFQFQVDAALDIVRTLVEQFVQKVPGPSHRAALEVSALVRVTTEGQLAEMLAIPDAHEAFAWLQSLSFIERGPDGLFPHDLARDSLVADLRWRNPDWYVELHRRARGYYATRLTQTRGLDQQRVLFDYVYLHRDNPLMRPYLDWQETGTTMPDVLRDGDQEALRSMVSQHEGEESAGLLDYWLKRLRSGVVVYRDASGQPTSFIVMVPLHESTSEDQSRDPAVRAASSYLERHAPLRPGERATLFRYWMARDTYQSVSAQQSLIFGRAAQHYLTTPGLAFSFFPVADPDFWRPMFHHVDLPRLPSAEFTVGERHFGVFAHDWRVTPPMAWLDVLGERELARSAEEQPPPPTATVVVLSKPEFGAAVRDALRDFTRPEALRQNPLLRSRLVLEAVGPAARPRDRARALQEVLLKAVVSLQHSPRDAKLYRALHHTYFEPAATQEKAAELLDVPFSTYRRHLTQGVAEVVELVWEWEIGES